jgi:hypothetical protein
VAFQLDACTRHLQGVFIERAICVANKPEAQQGLQQRHACPGLRPQLFLAELAGFVLQFSRELI